MRILKWIGRVVPDWLLMLLVVAYITGGLYIVNQLSRLSVVAGIACLLGLIASLVLMYRASISGS